MKERLFLLHELFEQYFCSKKKLSIPLRFIVFMLISFVFKVLRNNSLQRVGHFRLTGICYSQISEVMELMKIGLYFVFMDFLQATTVGER